MSKTKIFEQKIYYRNKILIVDIIIIAVYL